LRVVYYAKFLNWFEVGRMDLLRGLGLPFGEWQKRGFNIPVVQAHADYRSPALFDDEVLIKTRVANVGNSSIKFENEVYRLPQMQLLCTGHTVHALTNREDDSIPFPPDLKAKLTSS